MKKIILPLLLSSSAFAAEPIVRPLNFIVTPSTGPVAEVKVMNPTDKPIAGTLAATYAEGWKLSPAQQPFSVAPNSSQNLSFAIEKGLDRAANSYPAKIEVELAGKKTTSNFDVVCASTPFFKPKIDGKLNEWADAIPLSFETAGKNTKVYTYWNNQQFCLAVEVEEDQLIGFKKAKKAGMMDGIQFALAPGKSSTPALGEAAARYEYLAADAGKRLGGTDPVFKLVNKGDQLSSDAKELAPLLLEEADLKVSRDGNITTYELTVPMKKMKALRATAGREYNFSLLVHDPDGTGVRDLGSIMNIPDCQRPESAWSNWEFAKWNNYQPLDAKVEFGFCSSIH